MEIEDEPAPLSEAKISLREAGEIQAAHDRLLAIILGEVPSPFHNPHWMATLEISASVLCWVLRHEHNETFGEKLAEIDTFLASSGFILVDSGVLKPRKN